MLIPSRTLWRSQPQYPVRDPDWVIFNAPAKGIELPAVSRPINVATAQALNGGYANSSVQTTSLNTGLIIANDASAPLTIAGRVWRASSGTVTFAAMRSATGGWSLSSSNFDSNNANLGIFGTQKGTVLNKKVPWPANFSVDFAYRIKWISRATFNHFGIDLWVNGIVYSGELDADSAVVLNRFDCNTGCMFVGYKQTLLTDDELLALSLDATLLFPPREELIYLPDAGGVTMPILSAPSFAGRVPSVTITH